MSARRRLPDDAIIGALQRWRGNVTAAAEALGLAPINLRKRLTGLGVDLPLLRRLKDTGIHDIHTHPSVPIAITGTNAATRNHSAGGIFPRPAPRPMFGAVGTEAMMPRQKAPAPIRLGPEQVEELRNAKFELQYHLRAEVSESVILQQFFADGFAAWLKARLREHNAEERKMLAGAEAKPAHERKAEK